MHTLYRRLAGKSAALAATSILCAAMAWPALGAQTVTIDGRDLVARMQRMERDIRDLQAETFRRPPGAIADAPPPASGMPGDLNPIMRRMDEFGDSISRLTGQMEELSHQVDVLSQKADRLQKELDYQAQQTAQGQGAGPQNGPPPDNGGGSEPPPRDAVASLAPPSQGRSANSDSPPEGVLGRIPAGAPLPAPPPPGPNPKGEFDSAMGLLSRAQYDQATQAFRNFADNYPDDERASQALYYTADITFSIKKDYGEAARNFAELLKKYPMSARAPEGMLKLGLALLELNQTKEGCAALAALPAKYPAASPAIATRARNERRDNKCR